MNSSEVRHSNLFANVLVARFVLGPVKKHMTRELCVWEKQGEAKGKETVLGTQCRMMMC